MVNILFFTDIHLRAMRPVSRKDADYLSTIISKIDYMRDRGSGCDIAIVGGDIFHRAAAPHGVVVRAINAFSKFKIPVFTCLGQHDVLGLQGESIPKTAMGVLLESGVVKKLDAVSIGGINIYGIHAYDEPVWTVPDTPGPKVLVVHKFLTNTPFPGEKCYLLKDVAAATNADLILSGDIHEPHDVIINKKVFINPGSLSRMSIADRNRLPQAALITIEDNGMIRYNFEEAPSLPAGELFDLDSYEARMESEGHSRDLTKAMAGMVLSIRNEATNAKDMLEEFMSRNGASKDIRSGVMGYYNLAEQEKLQEI